LVEGTTMPIFLRNPSASMNVAPWRGRYFSCLKYVKHFTACGKTKCRQDCIPLRVICPMIAAEPQAVPNRHVWFRYYSFRCDHLSILGALIVCTARSAASKFLEVWVRPQARDLSNQLLRNVTTTLSGVRIHA
jgi:hypothetical protein